jgi:hypothetical protein
VPEPDVAAITAAASREAGGVPPALLGDYLSAVIDAARTGRRLEATELAAYARAGERAAQTGVALRGLVDLYLSATWRMWRELPAMARPSALRAAGLAVLRAADDAVAAAAEGFEQAHLAVARQQEAARIEFLDDLLAGRGDLAGLVDRGTGFGLRLAGPHQVLVASGPAGARYGGPAGLAAEQLVARAADPAPALTMVRSGRLIAVIGPVTGDEAARAAAALAAALTGPAGPATAPAGPAPDPPEDAGPARSRGGRAAAGASTGRAGVGALGGGVAAERSTGQVAAGAPGGRVAAGRPYSGPAGVARSHGEAADALDVADRLGLADPVVSAADLLIYRVLLRDRAALADLVGSVLGPLAQARDGAAPLLDTLAAYFASGQVAAAAARRLHLSVRAVTYRLARVAALTGKDPADPEHALALQVAVTGARLLDWPAQPLD